MESNTMNTMTRHGVLFLSIMCFGMASSPALGVNTLAIKTVCNEISSQQTPAQILIGLLRTFFSDFQDRTPYKVFIQKIILFLKDPKNAAAVQAEYPNLKVQELIAALETVIDKTWVASIGWTLKPFFRELPADLQDVGLLTKGVTQRLAIK